MTAYQVEQFDLNVEVKKCDFSQTDQFEADDPDAIEEENSFDSSSQSGKETSCFKFQASIMDDDGAGDDKQIGSDSSDKNIYQPGYQHQLPERDQSQMQNQSNQQHHKGLFEQDKAERIKIKQVLNKKFELPQSMNQY